MVTAAADRKKDSSMFQALRGIFSTTAFLSHVHHASVLPSTTASFA
jgi:hypothetical protein